MVEITENTIERVSNALAGIPGAAQKVFTKAINTALNAAKKDVYKGITTEYAISKDVLSRYTRERIKKATNDISCGEIVFYGKQIPLYKYDLTSPKQPNRQIKVMAGQKTAKLIEDAFTQVMPSNNHTGLFMRRGVNRDAKISELLGSSVRSMANEVIMDEVYEKAQKKMEKTIAVEVSKLLEGAGAK